MSAGEHNDQSPVDDSFKLVALATSKGGLAALSTVLAGLPHDFPAAVLVIQHLAPLQPSFLVEILAQRTELSVKWAQSGDRLRAGTVYVAPRAEHTVIAGKDSVETRKGERVRFCLPSADLLFESVARHYAHRAIAGVLTGALDDGASGLASIKRSGGVTFVQSPQSCICPSMPQAAMITGTVDYVLPLQSIAPALMTLTSPHTIGKNKPNSNNLLQQCNRRIT